MKRAAFFLVLVALVNCGWIYAQTQAEMHRLSTEMDRLAGAAIKAQDSGICNIHHIRMQRKMVPISFGGPLRFDTPFYYATMRYFPNAREHINGGCVIDKKLLGKKKPRYVCPVCKRAEREWALEHPKDDDAKWMLSRQKT
jgi:hypothetical protein